MAVALMSVALSASAQYYVGGSLGFTSTSISDTDQDGSSFKILPEIGYQLDKDLSIGVQVGYSHGYAAFGSLTVSDIKAAMNTLASTYADINDEEMKLNSFTIAPYVRYTIAEWGKLNVFVEGYIGYTNITSDGTPNTSGSTSNNKTKVNAFEIGVRPGVKLQLTDRVSVLCKLGSLGYLTAKEKESDMKLNRFGFDADTYNALLGFNFNF